METILLLIILLLFSGFFSGAEISFFSLTAEKLQALKNKTLKEKQLTRIRRLEILKSDPEKLLITILLGNNVVNIAASALATIFATRMAAERGFAENETLVIGLVTGVMTFLVLLFGEIIPKSFAHKYALKFALIITPFIAFLQFIFTPIVLPLSLFVKRFSNNQKTKHSLDESELKAALELSEREGKIDSDEKVWTEKILELNDHSVESVMTPRSKIMALEDSNDYQSILNFVQKESFSRIPVFHENLDNIIGILTVHAILEKINTPDYKKSKVANLPLRSPLKIPITMKIGSLFKEFQKHNTHMGMVYDEFGGLVGLITMEDILEEIFGEIHDEQDEAINSIRRIGKAKFLVSGETELESFENFVNEKLAHSPEKFPWPSQEENKTFGLFILEKLERFPQVGENFMIEIQQYQFTFTLQAVQPEQIEAVEILIKKVK